MMTRTSKTTIQQRILQAWLPDRSFILHYIGILYLAFVSVRPGKEQTDVKKPINRRKRGCLTTDNVTRLCILPVDESLAGIFYISLLYWTLSLCVILVILIAKYVLRPLVMRKEDYYND